MINYEGDLKPNSFTSDHSNYFFGLTVRKSLNRGITWRSGFSTGSVEGADRYNRDYLKPRNLSFYSQITEAYTGLALTILDISTKRFTPYLYGGIDVYRQKDRRLLPWLIVVMNCQMDLVILPPVNKEARLMKWTGIIF